MAGGRRGRSSELEAGEEIRVRPVSQQLRISLAWLQPQQSLGRPRIEEGLVRSTFFVLLRTTVRSKALFGTAYAVTAYLLWRFFDTLSGLQPKNQPQSILVQRFQDAAIVGAILFLVAFLVTILSLRAGLLCGGVACMLSWPYWAVQAFRFPWRSVIPLLASDVGEPEIVAMLMVALSSVCTLYAAKRAKPVALR
jgi:hypothetical protein